MTTYCTEEVLDGEILEISDTVEKVAICEEAISNQALEVGGPVLGVTDSKLPRDVPIVRNKSGGGRAETIKSLSIQRCSLFLLREMHVPKCIVNAPLRDWESALSINGLWRRWNTSRDNNLEGDLKSDTR
jgi:hypothetical protein